MPDGVIREICPIILQQQQQQQQQYQFVDINGLNQRQKENFIFVIINYRH